VTTVAKRFYPAFDAKGVSQRVAQKRGVTQASILQGWEEARAYGDKVHQEIMHDAPETLEAMHAVQLLHADKRVAHHEVAIGSLKDKLAGRVDCILENEDGSVDIWDWKTGSWGDGFNMCYAPFEKYWDSKLVTASLQLALYKLILESLGVRVRKMVVVYLSPKGARSYDAIDFGISLLDYVAKF
jgi:hypothetical protein